MVPVAHLSLQPKRDIDLMSRFGIAMAVRPYTLQWAILFSSRLPHSYEKHLPPV